MILKHFMLINLAFIIILSESALGRQLTCSYGTDNYYIVDSIYECNLKGNPYILFRNISILSERGLHKDGKNNSNVEGFYAISKIIKYFPAGIEKIFPFLKAILVMKCQLKEIAQRDLRAFPKLVRLALGGNEIEVIERDTFAFNPDLAALTLDENKISHIDANAFDDLNKLSYLHLTGNTCIDKDASGNLSKVDELKAESKMSCNNPKYAEIRNQLKEIENGFGDLRFSVVSDKIKMIQQDMMDYKGIGAENLNDQFGSFLNPTCTALVHTLAKGEMENEKFTERIERAYIHSTIRDYMIVLYCSLTTIIALVIYEYGRFYFNTAQRSSSQSSINEE